MISVRISADIKNTVVGSASYFAKHPFPETPSELGQHQCVRLRTSTYGGLYDWEFIDQTRSFDIRVSGSVICNNAYDILEAAKMDLDWLTFRRTWLSRTSIRERWSLFFRNGARYGRFHLYYPNRRQHSRAMTLMVEALRYKES